MRNFWNWKFALWQDGKLPNGKMMKWDNGKLAKWEIFLMTNCKIGKSPNGKKEKWGNYKWEVA